MFIDWACGKRDLCPNGPLLAPVAVPIFYHDGTKWGSEHTATNASKAV